MSDSIISAARWHQRSLAEQLGNIGVELSRAAQQKQKGNAERAFLSLDLAHELVSLTIDDARWKKKRLHELLRFRELLSDWYTGGREYGVPLENLVAYCMPFALRAREGK